GTRGGELGGADPQLFRRDAIEFERVAAHGSRALAANRVDDGLRLLQRARQQCRGGTRQGGGAARGIELLPIENLHRLYASIFSTGSTSSALAPAFFRLSSVSQNTFSRHTACTATRSGEPSSGMIVGDSLPGSSRRMAGSAERGACSMMYLLSLTCCTPSTRSSSRSTHSFFSGGSGTGVRISTAWLSSTVSTSRRWLACSVEPVEKI